VARVLAEIRTRVALAARDDFLQRVRGRHETLTTLGASYWVFEASDGSGETVQYLETKDDARMQAARAHLELGADEELVLLHQLEL